MSSISSIFNKLYTGDNKLRLLDQRYLPRWIVILLDFFLCISALLVTYFILEETQIVFHEIISLPLQAIVILGVNLFFFYLFKTYSGIIRHSTFTDIFKLILTAISTAGVIITFNYIYENVYGNKIFLTTSLLLYMFISFTFLLLFRLSVKESYRFLKNASVVEKKKRIAIIGVDDQTVSLGRAITTELELPFELVGFLTQKSHSQKYKILGKPVIPVSSFEEVVKKYDLEGVLLMSSVYTGAEKNEIVELCLNNDLEIFNVPNLQAWNSINDIQHQIKPLQIEDLLDRSPIKLKDDSIKKDLDGKTILITGGAGSIGSEIVNQIAEYTPKLVVILDQAETPLHELDLHLKLNFPEFNYAIELADISNMYRLELMFAKYNFDIIYHAAAYKHVPLIELNPHEAIYVNMLGTVNLCFQAIKHKIEKFVMVSTDKAVNPTNVMGATKRAAEMYVQAFQKHQGASTKFITTRFGNVLGSNGSVIPFFKQQIARGGPVTVTHKDIIRYFMTIPEACQLVLQAGTMGNGGEIYVFDMGKPIRIIDLAERMIKLSGLEPYKDIDVKIIGLRPGEKLFEELLNNTSTVLPTHHPKIMISTVPVGEFDHIKELTEKIIRAATKLNDAKVVSLLKKLVPEFKSENSAFQALDVEEQKDLSKI